MTGAHRYDVLVFDWDGTLLDSTAWIAGCLQQACRDVGVEPPNDERARHVIGLGLAEAIAHAVPHLPDGAVPRMLERYRHHFLAKDSELLLFPGIRELIASLRDGGWRLAIATGKPRVGLDRALATAGLADAFDCTRCADETRSKPDPRMLFEIGAALDVPMRGMLMIGDTSHDLAMAERAGVDALAVGYGAHPAPSLARCGALAVLESTEALANWLALHG